MARPNNLGPGSGLVYDDEGNVVSLADLIKGGIQLKVSNVTVLQATIPSGQSLSGSVATGGLALVGIEMPSTWTAADLSFQSRSAETEPWRNVRFGAAYALPAGANDAVIVPPADFRHANFLRVRSGTAATPVNQAAERVLRLLFAPLT